MGICSGAVAAVLWDRALDVGDLSSSPGRELSGTAGLPAQVWELVVGGGSPHRYWNLSFPMESHHQRHCTKELGLHSVLGHKGLTRLVSRSVKRGTP